MSLKPEAERRAKRCSKFEGLIEVGKTYGQFKVIGPFYRARVERPSLKSGWTTSVVVPVQCLKCGIKMGALPTNVLRNETGCRKCAEKRIRKATLYSAFGESPRSLREWSQDPRCRVTLQNLKSRLYLNWSLELAITTPLFNGRKVSNV